MVMSAKSAVKLELFFTCLDFKRKVVCQYKTEGLEMKGFCLLVLVSPLSFFPLHLFFFLYHIRRTFINSYFPSLV